MAYDLSVSLFSDYNCQSDLLSKPKYLHLWSASADLSINDLCIWSESSSLREAESRKFTDHSM